MTLWKQDDKILFYFDTDQMIVYPQNKSGFDKVFARIHINNTNPKGDTGQKFFSQYTIKSQKEKNAILVCPSELPSFITDLKVLVDLGYDATFKLTQCSNDSSGSISKYIEITGFNSQQHGGEIVRSYVQIESHFDKSMYPEEIEQKQIEFGIDSNTCMNVLLKFRNRLAILQD
mmetsp:Transcript_31677/g.48479  ORF Transcript_31677/g.48479 Transcript_31677/m.48479 type:complete len:174 (+) Transcript_31677:76-597(+)